MLVMVYKVEIRVKIVVVVHIRVTLIKLWSISYIWLNIYNILQLLELDVYLIHWSENKCLEPLTPYIRAMI